MGVSELGAPWGSLVVLLQRLAATLATSSNQNSMELALLAVRNHVNDAILHAQLHGPRITATVSGGGDGMEGKVCPCGLLYTVCTLHFGFWILIPVYFESFEY